MHLSAVLQPTFACEFNWSCSTIDLKSAYVGFDLQVWTQVLRQWRWEKLWLPWGNGLLWHRWLWAPKTLPPQVMFPRQSTMIKNLIFTQPWCYWVWHANWGIPGRPYHSQHLRCNRPGLLCWWLLLRRSWKHGTMWPLKSSSVRRVKYTRIRYWCNVDTCIVFLLPPNVKKLNVNFNQEREWQYFLSSNLEMNNSYLGVETRTRISLINIV